MMASSPSYQPVTLSPTAAASPVASAKPAGPLRARNVAKLALVLGVVVGAYVFFTLGAENDATQSTQTSYSISQQRYIPVEAPSEQELTFRSNVRGVLKAVQQGAPLEAFSVLSDGKDSVDRAQFTSIFTAVFHAGISELLNLEHVSTVGPTAPFSKTVREESQRMIIPSNITIPRLFDAIDTDASDSISSAEFAAFISSPDPSILFRLFDENRDGQVSAVEASTLLMDAISSGLFALQELIDVFSDGALVMTDFASQILIGPEPVEFSALWQAYLPYIAQVAETMIPAIDSLPAQTKAANLLQLEENMDDLKTAIGSCADPSKGLTITEYIAFKSQSAEGEKWSTSPVVLTKLQMLMQMMSEVPGVPMAGMPGGLATPTTSGGPAASLRGADAAVAPSPLPLPSFVTALLDDAQTFVSSNKDRLFGPEFSLMDHDGDGHITAHEAQTIYTMTQVLYTAEVDGKVITDNLERLRVPFATLFSLMDTNGDKKLSAEEGKAAMDGCITLAKDIVHVLLDGVSEVAVPRLVPIGVSLVISLADTDLNGTLSLVEVITFIQTMAAQQQQSAGFP